MKIYTSDDPDEMKKHGVNGNTPNLYRCGRMKNGKKYWAVTILPCSSLDLTYKERLFFYHKLKEQVEMMIKQNE